MLVCVYMCLCVYVYGYMHVYECMYICLCVHVCICECMCAYACVFMYIQGSLPAKESTKGKGGVGSGGWRQKCEICNQGSKVRPEWDGLPCSGDSNLLREN